MDKAGQNNSKILKLYLYFIYILFKVLTTIQIFRRTKLSKASTIIYNKAILRLLSNLFISIIKKVFYIKIYSQEIHKDNFID